MFGFESKDDLVGKAPLFLAPELQPDGIRSAELMIRHIENAKLSGFACFEWQAKRQNGELFYTEIRITPLMIQNELQFQCLILDIEKNKTEEKLRKILDAFDDHIYINNREYNILYANKAMKAVIGNNKIGTKCYKTIYNFDKPCYWCVYDDLSKSNDLIAYDIKVPDKEEYKYVRNIILENDHKLTIYQDITERKMYEKKLYDLNASKDKFISILAHDLKNPFNVLVGFSSVLLKNLKKYDLNKIEDNVRKINQISINTHDLLEEILLWTMSQSGKLSFEPKKYCLKEICDEIITNLKENAIAKEIIISCSEIENIFINADINMFKTIMRNLISNAIKFTYKGGNINISCDLIGNFAQISVMDSGIGISKDKISKIWDISQTSSTVGTAAEKGTGFGLILCKEFIEKQGGKIWVESTVNKGSSFIFTVPKSM